jgi:clan AA aspartic protease (TIGR02281 family)
MRRGLTLIVGVLIGQWLAFAGIDSPADVHRLAREAMARSDWNEAALQWSRAVALQPDNAYVNYMRAAALARLGHRHAAADALQVTLLLRPEESLARQIRSELAGLAGAGEAAGGETIVGLESSRGVWVVPVLVNGHHRGRFLLDTGASVVVFSPAFAGRVGARARDGDTLELDTLGGRTRGAWATIPSLRVGGAEVRNAEVIIHAPGGELDGILGNTFLNRWDLALDPDRRVLRLRNLHGDTDAAAAPADDAPAAFPRAAQQLR